MQYKIFAKHTYITCLDIRKNYVLVFHKKLCITTFSTMLLSTGFATYYTLPFANDIVCAIECILKCPQTKKRRVDIYPNIYPRATNNQYWHVLEVI